MAQLRKSRPFRLGFPSGFRETLHRWKRLGRRHSSGFGTFASPDEFFSQCQVAVNQKWETKMRRLMPILLLLPLTLAACGTTKRTTIVNAPPDKAVVVQPDGDVVVKRDDDRR